MKMELVKRGDIFWVDFNPARGSEQAGFRPALVIQNDVGNKYSPTTIVATITTSEKSFPFTVKVTAPEGGLVKNSVVNLSQIITVDKERLVNRLGTLTPARMQEVDRAIELSLGIKE